LGSVVAIASTSAVLDQITYDPFGNIVTQTNATDAVRFGFAGMEYDSTTGLYYDHARYYDAAIGRFVSQDPIGFSAMDTDLYRYADNDPTNITDDTGEFWQFIVFAVIAAILANPTPTDTPGGDNIATTGMLGTTIALGGGGSWFNLLCFVAGTPVSTERGMRPIEDMQEGDRVWSYDFALGRPVLRPVLSTIRRSYDGDVVTLDMGNETIRCTGDHPFWVTEGVTLGTRPRPQHVSPKEDATAASGRWIDARDIQVGDVLMRQNGEPKIVQATDTEFTRVEVFNLSVQESKNYCVGTNQLVVHNRPASTTLPPGQSSTGSWPGSGGAPPAGGTSTGFDPQIPGWIRTELPGGGFTLTRPPGWSPPPYTGPPFPGPAPLPPPVPKWWQFWK
jgi:RHS repeat-associated protein